MATEDVGNFVLGLPARFKKHPNEVGVGYIVHAVHAMGYAAETIVYGLMFLFHAIFPFWCTTSGSSGIKSLARKFEEKDATGTIHDGGISYREPGSGAPEK